MIKIVCTIHDWAEDIEKARVESEFSFDRSDESPFSTDFPAQVSAEDAKVLDAIRDFVNSNKADCEPPARVYAWVSAIQNNGEWVPCDSATRWYLEIEEGDDLEKLTHCDSQGWIPEYLVKITCSIHGEEDMELAGEEKAFGFSRDEESPFSTDFPAKVSSEDVKVLEAIRNLVNAKRADQSISNVFRVYAWVSAIQDCGEWSEVGDRSTWFVQTDLERIAKLDSSGWQTY
jgi:hypothetical protein